jgi:hypothetical protein
VFFKDQINEGANENLDVVSCLLEANVIVHVKVSLPFDWYYKYVDNEVKKDVCCFCIRSSNREVVNFLFKEDMVAVDDTRVQVWLVYCWSKPNFTKDGIGMFFPQSRDLE